ncbi:hypothetical protein GQ600_15782 [Phytophthora cactorum]|nr:hypothetical protein GQ600_15782 [Phytophthora cactorum]
MNDDFNRLVSDDSLFEGVEPHLITTHSGAKLKSMWKACNTRFAAAEASCPVRMMNSGIFVVGIR